MTNKELLKKVFTEGYFDENDFQKQGPKMVPQAVLVYSNLTGVTLCWGEEAENFSLNPYLVDGDGDVYVSGLSIGGVVKSRGLSLEKAIANYNKEHSYENGFSNLAIIPREQWLARHQ